jgi:hypothetical protein
MSVDIFCLSVGKKSVGVIIQSLEYGDERNSPTKYGTEIQKNGERE